MGGMESSLYMSVHVHLAYKPNTCQSSCSRKPNACILGQILEVKGIYLLQILYNIIYVCYYFLNYLNSLWIKFNH